MSSSEKTYKAEEVKLLFAMIQLAENKPPVEEVSKFMGLQKGATNMRIIRLMKRLEQDFGEPTNVATAPATTSTTTIPTNTAAKTKGRKRIVKDESEDDADPGATDDADAEVPKSKKTKKSMK